MSTTTYFILSGPYMGGVQKQLKTFQENQRPIMALVIQIHATEGVVQSAKF